MVVQRTRFQLNPEAALRRLDAYAWPLLGLAETARVLGLTNKALAMRRGRGKFIEPHAKLALGPVWTKEQVRDYILAWRRNND